MAEKQSPLKKLVSVHEENLPVRVVPKQRIIIPIVEDADLTPQITENVDPYSGMSIVNSSLTLNFNFNLDEKAVDRAVERSAKVAKGLAASAMAMLGTAFIFRDPGKRGKVRIPRSEKIKVPRVEN